MMFIGFILKARLFAVRNDHLLSAVPSRSSMGAGLNRSNRAYAIGCATFAVTPTCTEARDPRCHLAAR
jgi:hypothetical protein